MVRLGMFARAVRGGNDGASEVKMRRETGKGLRNDVQVERLASFQRVYHSKCKTSIMFHSTLGLYLSPPVAYSQEASSLTWKIFRTACN